MKKIYVLTSVALILLIGFMVQRNSKPQTQAQEAATTASTPVEIRPLDEFKTLTETIELPASIVGDQEVSVVAKSSGIATAVPFSLGSYVSTGTLIARIDDQSGKLDAGRSGFVNSQLQQSDLAIKQAEESYKAAKKNYSNVKDDPASTKTQIDSAKAQRNLAELQLKNAKIAYKGTFDSHLTTAPISGFVTSKNASAGDAVSSGQVIATISKTKAVKVQFYISAEHLPFLRKGMEISIKENSGDSKIAVIRNISPVADPETKRFLIEAFPKDNALWNLYSGTVASVSFVVTENPQNQGSLIVPLSSLTVGQNESYVFVALDGIARQVKVNVQRVDGEFAEIEGSFDSNMQLITKGNAFIKEGEAISSVN